MTRRARFDYASELNLDPAVKLDAYNAPAQITPQGYLLADAYLARDGLLRYSDGEQSWIEYRPRAELERAAETWANAPITDDHPSAMVTSETWTQVAKGVHVGMPSVVGPLSDGISYLRARVLVTDAATVAKIRARGGPRQLSIGFTSEVVPTTDGRASDGTRCDAVQTELLGNHTALVAKGRAGPAVRILLDGAAVLVPHLREEQMTQPKNTPAQRGDEAGAPVEQVEVTGPMGEKAMVPTWVAAKLAGQPAAPPPVPPMAPPMAPPAPVAPVDAAPPPMAPPGPPAPPKPEDEEKSMDGFRKAARRRSKLERLAAKAGIPDAKIDSIEDDDELARAYLAIKLPHAPAKDARGDALDVLVATAAAAPEPAESAHPWEQPAPRGDAEPELEPEIDAFLAATGY